MIEIIVNSKRGTVLNCPKKIAQELYSLCSYQSPGYEFTEAFLSRRWDGYVRKFSIKTNSFPAGLLTRIKFFLKRKGIKFVVKDRRIPLKYDEETVLKNIDKFKFVLRDYQIDGLITGLENPYMIYWWATASGKTVEFAAVIAALKTNRFKKTLIIVVNKDLADQHREELSTMLRTKIGFVQEGIFKPEDITVAVINTLWKKALKKDKSVLKFLDNIECLIIDECHHAIESKMIRDVINKCSNTMLRHGYSGSPYSLTVDDIELECLTGAPLSKVTLSDLIEKGYISRPNIFIIEHPTPHSSRGMYGEIYRNKIVENSIRNSIVIKVVKKYYNTTDKSILILIRIIDHGKILMKMLLDAGVNRDDIEFIHGSSPKFKRSKVKEDFKKKALRIVIASQIWNEGIDVPAIDVLIKADAGGGGDIQRKVNKGIRSLVQQEGRSLRKPIKPGEIDVRTEEETFVDIYDFWDDFHRDFLKHSSNRLRTYQIEPAFRIERIKFDE